MVLLHIVAAISFAFFGYEFAAFLEHDGLLQAMPFLAVSFVLLGIAEAVRLLRAEESPSYRNVRLAQEERALWRT
jgi:hypothetical protein